MSMLENLNRLLLLKPDTVDLFPGEHQELATYCVQTAYHEQADRPDTDVSDYASGMHHGVLVGLVYAAEFGLPDLAKNLFSVEAEK
ncbi:hypothetical protein LCGC14_1198040 [marine sediment metagenome]|uniref:Uncharacterized protein n=1 Tax=marine sediment metagenome TaxID=412755 RepID=A0A0F9LM72_9ZZZZ